jgi:hypothetical protein
LVAGAEREEPVEESTPDRSPGVQAWVFFRLLDGWWLVDEEGRRAPKHEHRFTQHHAG